jgi:DNA modification methylase
VIDLRLGDCVAKTAEITDASIDLILTSPPYDNLRRYHSGSSFDFEALAGQLKRVLKPGGVLVWVVGDQTIDGGETGTSFRQSLHFQSIGLRRHDTMIWNKLNPMQCGSRICYTPSFEFMFVHSNGRPVTVNRIVEPCKQAGKATNGIGKRDGVRHAKSGRGRPVKAEKPRGNVWGYSVGSGRYLGHPAVFPLQLAIDHILSWTNPGDVVLDPFVGSGTVGEACLKTDRDFIGIDISPAYLAIAERRIAAEITQTPLFRAP